MKKNILLVVLSVGFVSPVLGMQKASGALQTTGGAVGIASGASMAVKFIANGALVTNPLVVLGGGLALTGVCQAVSGLEKLFSKGELKVENSEILIQFKDPKDSEVRYLRFHGTDVDNFLKKNGFIISWRGAYPINEKIQLYQNTINNELTSLSRHYGRPMLYNRPIELNNPELRAAHPLAVENPGGLDALANELAQNKDLFVSLRGLAIISYGTPDQKDNLPLFVNATSKVIARLMTARTSAHTFPYEELVRNEQRAKAEAEGRLAGEREERNRITMQYNQTQNNYAAERAQRNQIQQELIQERNARLQIETALNETQRRLEANRDNAIQDSAIAREEAEREKHELESANERLVESYRQRFIRTYNDLQQANQNNENLIEALQQTNQDNDNLIESYRSRVVRLADLNQITTQALESEREQRARERERLQTLRAQENEQAAREYASVRSQLSPLRRKANEVSPLRRQIEAAEAQVQEKDAELALLRRQLAEARAMAWHPTKDDAVVQVVPNFQN